MRAKQQSALEYLTTYGWAILAIGVILVVLYSLGIFNSATFVPKAKAGSCQIVDGQLQGECIGSVPQYVAQFNGQSTYVTTGQQNFSSGGSPRTVTAWVYIQSYPTTGTYYPIMTFGTDAATGDGYGLWINSNGYVYEWGQNDDVSCSNLKVPLNTWSFIAVDYLGGSASGSVVCYLNSQSQSSAPPSGALTTANTRGGYIGATWNPAIGFTSGQISNVQVYDNGLPSNEVTRLYDEGIGGAPVDQIYVAGWWPLNGNVIDYSNNGNSGNAINIFYTDSWYSSYKAP